MYGIVPLSFEAAIQSVIRTAAGEAWASSSADQPATGGVATGGGDGTGDGLAADADGLGAGAGLVVGADDLAAEDDVLG